MFKYSLSLLFRRKLRTFLASLGITISVVLLSFIIFGMNDLKALLIGEFSQRFSPNEVVLTAQQLNFLPSAPTENEEATTEPKTLMTDELVDDLTSLSYVQKATPFVVLTGMQIEIEDSEGIFDQSFIAGMDVDGNAKYFVDFDGDKDAPESDEAYIANYVVESFGMTNEEIIGETVVVKPSATSFFSAKSKSILGKEFKYTIVGVYDPGQDRNDLVVNKKQGVAMSAEIGGFADNEEYLSSIGYDQIIFELEEEKIDDFKELIEENYNISIISSDDILGFLDTITQGLTMALIMFGTVSGVVASIGIINTMVMSIYEQTREIGIIKAIGASNRQVLMVFLIQAGFIGLFGGLLGLGVVFSVMTLSDGLIVEALNEAGFVATTFFHFDLINALWIALGSIIVGVVAGVYPAMRAAKLDPVKALRYE